MTVYSYCESSWSVSQEKNKRYSMKVIILNNALNDKHKETINSVIDRKKGY